VRSLSLTVTFPDCPKITGAIAKHWPELRELSMELKRLRESGIPGFDDSDDDGDDDTESRSDDMMGGPIIGMWGEDDSSGWDSGEELELERGLYEANIDPADLERQLLGAGVEVRLHLLVAFASRTGCTRQPNSATQHTKFLFYCSTPSFYHILLLNTIFPPSFSQI
jgi:hypothetical protein